MATPIDVFVFKCRKKNCLTRNRWNRALFAWPKIGSLWLSLLSGSHPISARASPPPPTLGSKNSKLHRNQLVIAERMKVVLLARTVFPIFAFWRISRQNAILLQA